MDVFIFYHRISVIVPAAFLCTAVTNKINYTHIVYDNNNNIFSCTMHTQKKKKNVSALILFAGRKTVFVVCRRRHHRSANKLRVGKRTLV